jgi:hypothetical protein
MRFTSALIAACALVAATTSSPAATTPASSGDVTFSFCPNVSSTIAVKKLRYEPFPPKIKEPLTVIASGALSTTVTQGARMIVTAKLGTMVVATQLFDICAESAKSGLNCPIPPGNHDLKSAVDMPKGIQVPPFVTIAIKAEAFNGDGSKLFCVDTTAKFQP